MVIIDIDAFVKGSIAKIDFTITRFIAITIIIVIIVIIVIATANIACY